MPEVLKRYVDAEVEGERVQVVDPALFYSAPSEVAVRGLGLYCRVDLEPGDRWWAHAWDDARFVSRVVPWSQYQQMSPEEQRTAERLSYIDVGSRWLIYCTEPFCRVNHAGRDSNTEADPQGNSLVTRPIPAGTEITQFYGYDTVLSILWKFPSLRDALTEKELADESFLFSCVSEQGKVLAFLQQL